MVVDSPKLPDRFWNKVSPEPNSGCWLWFGSWDEKGYGRFGIGGRGKHKPAHRVSYEALVGAVAPGLELDHGCRVRCCVNPAHLEPVTHLENMRRVPPQPDRTEYPAVCARGHDLSGDNLSFLTRRNSFRCRQCHRDNERERYRSNKNG